MSQHVVRSALRIGFTVSSASPRPPPARNRNQRLAAFCWGPFGLLVIWQIASMTGLLSPKILTALSTAATTGFDMLESGVLDHHLLASAQRAYLGLGIGVVFGLAFALVAGLTRSGDAMVDGLVQIKRVLPLTTTPLDLPLVRITIEPQPTTGLQQRSQVMISPAIRAARQTWPGYRCRGCRHAARSNAPSGRAAWDRVMA